MKKILITLGDPNGIGTEVTVKALQKLNFHHCEIIGNHHNWEPFQKIFPNIVFHCIDKTYLPKYGEICSHAGRVALKNLDKAIELLSTDNYLGLVTAPICKESIILSGKSKFIGHTEYLAEAFNTNVDMVFWSPIWSTLLITTHVPLKDVSSLISQEKFRYSVKQAISFNQKFGNNGAIAVCGLNPHAGENGAMGTEEIDIFHPILKEFQDQVAGVFSPDTVFIDAEKGKFSMIISPSHDQALIPFKLLHFHDGVNVSYGLPFIRTSPDHGTAFDIAGTNQADPSSMISAINFIINKVKN